MAAPSKSAIVDALMRRHGRTYCEELRIPIEKNQPSALFRWLVAALLFSARIGAPQAVKAARALFEAGWTSPRKMAAASWQERVDVLNAHGYARYDESTARMLADTCLILIEHYGGDLRRLRDEAGGEAKTAERLLKAFKGIGPAGAAIFLREAQGAWPEYYPYADQKTVKAAGALGLGGDAKTLAAHVPREKFPAFVTALVRADLARETEALKKGELA